VEIQMIDHAVVLREVTKTFGAHTAVDALNLTVPTGSVYGFIGPNGSGKTTTLRMIMRILHPDRGEIEVLGQQSQDAATDLVGYLPEERGLYKQMKVRDVLAYYAELKGMRNSRAAVAAWLARLDLTAWADKQVQALSKGMAQKVQFIAAVVTHPKLVLLDEPFSGLDPVNMDVLREAILELRRDGTTVIFSTHDMAVAERMCDSIFMIYQGKKVLDGSLQSIQGVHGADTIRVRFSDGSPSLHEIPGVQAINDFGQSQELRLSSDADPQHVLAALMDRCRILHFEVARPSLHDIFVRIARPNSEENGHA
jgi:ABC-2 type transport system ATP-binding protein